MKAFSRLLIFAAGWFILACAQPTEVHVVAPGHALVKELSIDLAAYLGETYSGVRFEPAAEMAEGKINVILEISDDPRFENAEAFEIIGKGKSLSIRGKTPRALINGSYALLKHLGWHFYLSFHVPPVRLRIPDFNNIHISNAPLKEKRIIFNWHNFLSGCTGWDLQQWQEWIGNASAIGYNTIMVHAYGNNPMHSFSFNGREKEPGYLTTTMRGRDWGAQHVNDIRRLPGADFLPGYEMGAAAARVAGEERGKAATELMQQVFRHASKKGMEICFALDVDTWMANPQNIITSLPEEALIEIAGYKTVNPDHPQGRKYYEAQLTRLFSDYPEITMLAAWMRKPVKQPGLGSIWLLHESATLPAEWRKEYFGILQENPDLKDERPYPGLYAISRIIRAYREILDSLKPGVELALGSWETGFVSMADPFIPDYCSFIPLDWSYVLNQPEILGPLAKVGQSRTLYPVVWAHHDDHRYIGRPYKPFPDLNTLLNSIKAPGYGIIHWTTHPLDLIFTNYENQVWKNTENETLEKSVADFTEALLKRKDENLVRYFKAWFSEAPMFGRETSDFFQRLNEDYHLEGYTSSTEVVERAKERLAILGGVNMKSLNRQGLREFLYQRGIEEFIVSFFSDHANGHQAYRLLAENKIEEARTYVLATNPVGTIRKYAAAIRDYGATKGEEGILVSLGLRWLPDYIDLRQRTGLEPVRINFQPTSHDPLAQGAGRHTFFAGENGDLWLSLGEKELGIPSADNGNLPLEKITDSWLDVAEQVDIPLRTMRNFNLPAADYKLELTLVQSGYGCTLQLWEGEKMLAARGAEDNLGMAGLTFTSEGDALILKIIPAKGSAKIGGLVIHPL